MVDRFYGCFDPREASDEEEAEYENQMQMECLGCGHTNETCCCDEVIETIWGEVGEIKQDFEPWPPEMGGEAGGA
jgi:hypothetical protein